MRQDFFQFDSTHKFIIAANHRPQVRTMDYAMRRRLLLVPFNQRFDDERRDVDMLAKLQAEAGAVLAWLIAGATDWHESGLRVPDRVRAATDAYADAMDSLRNWLAECCELDPDARGGASVLYRSYRDWKIERGEQPVSMTRWGEQMGTRRFEKIKDSTVKYCGISLTADERSRIETATPK